MYLVNQKRSYLVLFFIHPGVEGALAQIKGVLLYFLDGVLLGLLSADAGATIFQLVKTSQLMKNLRQAGDELRLKAHLGKAEFFDLLENIGDRLEDLMPEQLDEAGRAAKERYDELMARTEIFTRRFRETYQGMRSSLPDAGTFESVKRRGEWIKNQLKQEKKENKKK